MKLVYTYSEKPYISMGYKEYLVLLSKNSQDPAIIGDFAQRMPICINCERATIAK